MTVIHNIQGWLGKKIWFLVLLPVFYFLHLATEYHPVITPGSLVMPVSAWLLGVPIFLYVCLRFIKPSFVKYAVCIFYLELIFFFFSNIHLFIEKAIPFLGHYKTLLPLLALGLLLLIVYTRKMKAPPFRFFLYLNTLMIVLLIVECGQYLIKTVPSVKKALSFNNPNSDLPPIPPCDTCLKPDVYFIIFDSYTSSKQLKDYWHYDNSGLDSFLLNRGFYDALHSRSNYNYTPFSIGSILNMDYHRMTFNSKIDMLQYCEGIKTIENNRVCRLFEQMGYTIINHSFFPVPGDKPRQDLGFLVSNQEMLLTPTLFFKIQEDIAWNFVDTNRRVTIADEIIQNKLFGLQQTQNTYRNLLALASQPHDKPLFVYTHLLLPHDPYFYDSSGKVKPQSAWNNQANIEKDYLEQLKYTNTLIKNMVDHLQKTATRPRVIIIQGDHGYRDYPIVPNNMEFNNLNAIYCPDRQYAGLYDSITSVNTFRFILHKYFKAPLSLLKDSTVYIRH